MACRARGLGAVEYRLPPPYVTILQLTKQFLLAQFCFRQHTGGCAANRYWSRGLHIGAKKIKQTQATRMQPSGQRLQCLQPEISRTRIIVSDLEQRIGKIWRIGFSLREDS